MSKVCKTIERIIFSLSFTYFIFFNLSCGLDTYYVMETPVKSIIHEPEYSSIQYNEKYFEFWTNENVDYPNGFSYKGVDVYYKIYSSYSTMLSEKEALIKISSDSETAAKAPDKLMETGYDYQKLGASNSLKSPLIQPAASDQRIYIRLTDYQSNPDFAARIESNGSNLPDTEGASQPVRAIDQNTFNFGRKGERDKKPTNDSINKDVKYTTLTDNLWYVCMFAVAVGQDSTYKNYYSNIVYLGAVSINDSIEDN